MTPGRVEDLLPAGLLAEGRLAVRDDDFQQTVFDVGFNQGGGQALVADLAVDLQDEAQNLLDEFRRPLTLLWTGRREVDPDDGGLSPPPFSVSSPSSAPMARRSGEYVRGRIYRGILTGLNAAFVVDRATRDRLIAEHKSSVEVLKPFLRGRDVKRWASEPCGLWLLYIPWHFPMPVESGTTGASAEAERLFAKDFPAVYAHLSKFRAGLEARNQVETGICYEWYALQRWGADYWREFSQPKIVIPAITARCEYALDTEGFYSNDKTSICVADNPRFVVGVLNSAVGNWFIRKTAAEKQGGFYEFKPMYVSAIPIPTATPTDQATITTLVDRILAAKRSNDAATVASLEAEIDTHVYRLYRLTPDEIAIVQGGASA